MNKSILYLEIIDDQQLLVYQKSQQIVITDDQLSDYQDQKWVLLDSLFIGGRVFDREVKDKKILMQVIESSFSDDLLKPSFAYQFGYQKINNKLWVNFIEKERLNLLVDRFRPYLKNIIALSSMQQLLVLRDEQNLWVDHKQLVYLLLENEVTCLKAPEANLWETANERMLDKLNWQQDISNISNDSYKKIPNLWIKQQKNLEWPIKTWLMAVVLIFIIWSVNSYLNVFEAKKQVQVLRVKEAQILKEVYPKAPSSSAYARIKSGYNQIVGADDFSVLEKINMSLSSENKISYLDINLLKKQVILEGSINKNTQKRLQKAGFKLSNKDKEVILKW